MLVSGDYFGTIIDLRDWCQRDSILLGEMHLLKIGSEYGEHLLSQMIVYVFALIMILASYFSNLCRRVHACVLRRFAWSTRVVVVLILMTWFNRAA